MEGKRVLMTGGNSGIGLVASVELAKLGAEMVLLCRDGEKTATALQAINAVAKTPAVNIPVDLANFASVRQASQTVLDRYDRIDVLVNNAGTFPAKQGHTDDGYEMQIGVNHLAPFLMTNLLLERLKESAPARVITVTSMLHKKGAIDFDSFKGFAKYSPQTAYNQSKLANVLFAVELAERLKGTGVTSNMLHPGAVATDIIRDMPWIVRKIIGLFFISPEKGAQTTIQLASDEALALESGSYYNQGKLDTYSDDAKDAALRAKLWDVSAEAVGLTA